MKNVDIIGTCYTRELFNTTNEYTVNTYLMQQSIFTMFSKPLIIDSNDIRSHDNYNFKNRMIYYEFNKLGLLKLIENPSEYLVIDLVDGVRDVFEFKIPQDVKIISTKDTKLTLEHLKTKEYYNNISYYTVETQNYSDDDLEQFLKKFIDILLEIYDEKKIILNKVQMQNVYYEDNKIRYIDDNFFYNRRNFIKRLEEIFLRLLPNCKVLYTDNEPIIDINHRLGGPHPLHFEIIYYKYRMNVLSDLINNTGLVEKINKSYDNERNMELKKIKVKKLNK